MSLADEHRTVTLKTAEHLGKIFSRLKSVFSKQKRSFIHVEICTHVKAGDLYFIKFHVQLASDLVYANCIFFLSLFPEIKTAFPCFPSVTPETFIAGESKFFVRYS